MPQNSYKHILFPGRHHLLTNFQYDYFIKVLEGGVKEALDGEPITLDPDAELIFVVTSSNHENTRRNPLPGNRREVAIEHFGAELPIRSFTYHLNDIGASSRFADFTVKEVAVQSRGQHLLTPEDTLVACSTPAVIELYESLGYRILPVELTDRQTGKYAAARPWDAVLEMVKNGTAWQTSKSYQELVHESSKNLLEKYRLGDLIVEVHNDPVIGDEGDITETRDYQTYRKSFEDGGKRKYELIKRYIQPGRIVDIGCATGEIIRLMSEDDKLRETDLYGIEVARKLYQICERRKADGEFKNENTFFYQRNIMQGKLFPDNSIQTTTTMSLTHEIESYIGSDALRRFLKQIYDQTALGGTYINLDVVGPQNKDEQIYMSLSTDDGAYIDDPYEEFSDNNEFRSYLDNLSTFSKFKRFAQDFRAVEGDMITYELTNIEERPYIKLRLGDACEFLSKKDYTDSWLSEMHEKFCFWNFKEWKEALEETGFKVDSESGSFQNEWIVNNRYKPVARLFQKKSGTLKAIDFPVTNVLLVAKK